MSTTPAGKPRRASRSDILSFIASNRSPPPFGPRRRESRDSVNSELDGWHISRANTPDPDRIFGRRSPDSSDIQIVIDPVREPPALSALSVDAEPTPYHTPREAFQNVEGAELAGGPKTPPKRRMPYIDNMDENIWTEFYVPYRLEPSPSDWGPYTASEEWGTINKPSAPAAGMMSFNQKSALRNVNPALSTLGALTRPSGQIKVNKIMDSLAHPIIQASNERKHAKHIPKTVLEPELSSVAHSIGTSSGIPEDSIIWTDYVNEAEQQDHEQIANWNQMMDVLLVFAALFSAILTAFIIEVYKVLKPDPQDLAVDLLRNISISLQASLQNSLPSESVLSPQFIPSSGYMWVNGLWFASLSCSLGTAMLIILVKQWLQFYSVKLWNGTSYWYAKRRQFRYNALQKWHVSTIISVLPLLLHTAVVLFALGLVVMLHEINQVIAYVVTGLIAALLTIYGVCLLLPLVYKDCPYRSSASIILEVIWDLMTYSLKRVSLSLIQLATSSQHTLSTSGGSISTVFKSTLQKHKSVAELSNVLDPSGNDSDSLEQDTVLWLASTSQNPRVIENSLTFIRYLPHTSDMISKILKSNVLEQLAKKAYVPLPQKDDLMWKQMLVQIPSKEWMNTIEEVIPYMLSLISIWSHTAYLKLNGLPAISEAEHENTTHAWLLGDWIQFWRMLRQLHHSKIESILQSGWNIDAFVTIVCTEAMYYQRHVQPQTLPRLNKIENSFNLNEPNPLHDLYELIDDQQNFDIKLSNETLICLFGVFKHVLAMVDLTQKVDFKEKTLILLIQCWKKNQLRLEVSYQIVLCIRLMLIDAVEEKKSYIANEPKASSSLILQAFSLILENQFATKLIGNTELQEMQTKLVTSTLLEMYQVICNEPSLGVRYQAMIYTLPAKYTDELIQYLATLEIQEWRDFSQIVWFSDFLLGWISKGILKNEKCLSLLFCLQDILESLNLWKEQSTAPVIHRVLSLLINQLDVGYAEEKLIVLHSILKQASKIQDEKVLGIFLRLEGPSKVIAYLHAKCKSQAITSQWKSLHWDIKKLLANSANLKKSRETTYQVLNQLHEKLGDIHKSLSEIVPDIPSITQRPLEDPEDYMLSMHKTHVSSFAFSPDGKSVASGSWNTGVCIWDIATNLLIGKPMYKYTSGITSLSYSASGKYLVSGSEDGSICLWNAEKQENLHDLKKKHNDAISSVVFSFNEQYLLSGSWDNTACLWDISMPQAAKLLEFKAESPVTTADISPNTELIVTGSSDHSLILWDARTTENIDSSRLIKSMSGHSDFITAVVFVDDHHFISSSWDKTVQIWNVHSGLSAKWTNLALLTLDLGKRNDMIPLAISSDSHLIVWASQHDIICTFIGKTVNIATHKTFKGHHKLVTASAISPQQDYMVSGSKDFTLRIWNIGRGIQAVDAIFGHHSEITAVTYSHDGDCIASGSEDGNIFFWDAKTGIPAKDTVKIHVTGGSVEALAFSTDNKYIASGAADSTIYIWNIATGDITFGPLYSHPAPISFVTFSTDNLFLLSCSEDSVVCVWNVLDGICVKKLVNLLDKI